MFFFGEEGRREGEERRGVREVLEFERVVFELSSSVLRVVLGSFFWSLFESEVLLLGEARGNVLNITPEDFWDVQTISAFLSPCFVLVAGLDVASLP